MVSKLEQAKVELILSHPFFANVLFHLKIIETQDAAVCPTLAVNNYGTMYINTDFIEKFAVKNVVYMLAHEILHVIYSHANEARIGSRNPMLWNIAADGVINDILDDDRVGERINGLVHMPGASEFTVEQVYKELEEGAEEVPTLPDGWQDLRPGDKVEGGKPLTSEDVKFMAAKAAQAAKMQGKMSGSLEKFISKLLEVKTPWHEILERYMTDFSANESSWKRPNKRYGDEFYLPSLAKLPTMGELAVVIDVSGSISEPELNYYASHLTRIISSVRPTQVHVLYTDTQVVKHDTFNRDEEVGLTYTSGGGTCMEAAFSYIEERGIAPVVAVVLTDGFDNYTSPPSFPVVWCISNETQTPPYGQVIRFEMKGGE